MATISQDSFDRQMMMRAIRLAEQGLFTASPNPRVGCVITKNHEVLAEGWHEKAGEAHAEIVALAKLKNPEDAVGACVYVSLEPCSHTGKTGPCADALIKAGVTRVVCAMIDPAPNVSGKGFEKLKAAGIEVVSSLLEVEARELNPGFIKRMEKGLPFVRLKLAMSLDGKTALHNGESKWITGEAARRNVHLWRARSDAILTGSATIMTDNPAMTARLENGVPVRQPLCCVIDSKNRISRDARIFQTKTVTVGLDNTSDWIVKADEKGKVDLLSLLQLLAKKEINEVWVEAGASLAGALIEKKLVDELFIYMAPVILGDKARSLLEISKIERMSDRYQLELLESRQFGQDLRLRYGFK